MTINNDLVLGIKNGTEGNADRTTTMTMMMTSTMTAMATTRTTPTIHQNTNALDWLMHKLDEEGRVIMRSSVMSLTTLILS